MDFDPGSPSPPLELPVNGPGYTHLCWQAPSSAPVWSLFVASGLRLVTRGGAPVDLGGYGVTYAYGRDRDGTMIEMETMDRPVRADPAWATHVAVVTPDLDRLIAFYQTVLGQPPRRRAGPVSGARFDAIADMDGLSLSGGWFTLRNFEIEMWQYHTPATPVPSGDRPIDRIGHSLIAFEVADLRAATRRLRAADVRLVGRPVRMMGWRIQYARDPDGNLIAVQQRAGAGEEESVVPFYYLDPAAGPVRRT
jgi:catechol 2,3-dioxygenase-like lactoylglutathione lyase family enzyme